MGLGARAQDTHAHICARATCVLYGMHRRYSFKFFIGCGVLNAACRITAAACSLLMQKLNHMIPLLVGDSVSYTRNFLTFTGRESYPVRLHKYAVTVDLPYLPNRGVHFWASALQPLQQPQREHRAPADHPAWSTTSSLSSSTPGRHLHLPIYPTSTRSSDQLPVPSKGLPSSVIVGLSPEPHYSARASVDCNSSPCRRRSNKQGLPRRSRRIR